MGLAKWGRECRYKRCGNSGKLSNGGMKHGRQLYHRAAKRGCEVVSSLEVVRDFLQKLALELGGEEPREFWGMAFQAERERQQERLGLIPHTRTTCWSLIFCSQGPAVFLIFYNTLVSSCFKQTQSCWQEPWTCGVQPGEGTILET